MAQIPKGLPVRWFLIAFAVVLLGPVLALAAVTLSQYAASERTRYVEDGRKAARQIAADVDHELGKVQAAAEALATSPLIANGDYEAFQRQASKFLQTWAPDTPDAYAVILRDLNGQQLVNTRLPWGTPLPKVERDVDRLVIATKRSQVQDLFFSTSANRLMIAVRVPVLEDGGVTRVLSLALEPRRIAKLLQAQELSAEWNRGIVDRNDRVVARWPEHDRFMGAQVTENLRRNAVGNEGVLVSTNLEGIPVLVAYTRSELSGWRAVVGIPLSAFQGPLRSWQWSVTVLSLAGLILLIGLAFWFGRRIARPIHTLEVSAEQLAKGQPVLPVTTGLHEIDAVGRTLALASEELREREQALRESERRLRATYDNAAVGIMEVDQGGRVFDVNATHCELMGISRDALIGRCFIESTHPDDRDRDWELFSRQVKGELPIYTIEKRQIRGDGSVRWARVSSTAVCDAAGRFLYAVRILEDITERKQAEIALRELNLSLERRIEARTREIERMGEANRRAAITRERLRMARDLHDTLANSIVGLLLQIRVLRKQLTQKDPTLEAELIQAEESAREALAQTRAAVGELRFQALGEKGLGVALERLTARLRDRTSLEITLHVDPAAAGLEDEKAEVLYRIAEEAVRNVERHSAAERVDVSVRADHLDGAERLTLTVADDGAGFDPEATPSGHYGLTGMREQAELIGAELRVGSAPGQGTRVSVSVPV